MQAPNKDQSSEMREASKMKTCYWKQTKNQHVNYEGSNSCCTKQFCLTSRIHNDLYVYAEYNQCHYHQNKRLRAVLINTLTVNKEK